MTDVKDDTLWQRSRRSRGESLVSRGKMASRIDYQQKFESFRDRTWYESLPREERDFIGSIAFAHRMTFQEFRQVVEASRDLDMWGEGTVKGWWQSQNGRAHGSGKVKGLLQELVAHLATLKRLPKSYPPTGLDKPARRDRKPIVTLRSDKKIWGRCPVASEKTVCCNLWTIDAVENCVFGCSYCTVQTFYQDEILFDETFADKIRDIPLDPDRFYHIGTGQASDSLAWGNRNGILDALCEFAVKHPNVLLELKTKSDRVRYLLTNEVPENVVCSWSLNTPTIIANEEHFTANFDKRIEAARSVADRGIKVAFHFHPMVCYDAWDVDYPRAARDVMSLFESREVSFISFGSVTLIKPVISKIRELANQTKILQMELVKDPHGKLTYPDPIKVAMFKTMYRSFEPWHDQVFMYLCMEKPAVWEKSLGYVYRSNEEFERDFARKTLGGGTQGRPPS